MQTILALGDSYTIGEGVPASERWTSQLVEKLGVPAQLTTVAQTGWTTRDLLEALSHQTLEPYYDRVFLLIGVNNQFQGLPLEKYRQEFRQLLGFALQKTNNQTSRVCVLSIPDWSVTPFALNYQPHRIREELELFNEVNRAEAINIRVGYRDITEISRQAKRDLTLLAEDRLHPSGKMYELWAKEILKKQTDIYES